LLRGTDVFEVFVEGFVVVDGDCVEQGAKRPPIQLSIEYQYPMLLMQDMKAQHATPPTKATIIIEESPM